MFRPAKGLLFLCLLLLNVLAFAYITDSAIYAPPPDYLNPTLPGVGMAFRFTDPVFNPSNSGEWIWRITDARNTPRIDGVPGNLTAIQHEYSTTSPFNQSKTYLLLIHTAYFALYDGDGRFIRHLLQVCPTCAPRWSRSNPSSFSYLRYRNTLHGPQVYQYDATTDVHTPVAELPFDDLINKGEDDICFDGDHRVGFGRRGSNYFLYVFSISQARVISELPIGSSADMANVDSAQIAPDDIVIVTYVATDRNAAQLPAHGIWAFDINLSPLRQVFTVDSHHDIGRDDDGSPILVVSNGSSFQALPNCVNGIEKISINNPADRRCLLSSVSWTLSAHVSLPDQSGFVFLSMVSPGDPIYGSLSRKEESSPRVSKGTTPWTLETNPMDSDGKAMWSDNDVSRVTYSFYGTKVHWLAYQDASSGIAEVGLDGNVTTVDLYSASPQAQAIVYSRENLPIAFHTLTIDVTPTKNPASSGYKIWIDAIEDDTPWAAYTNEILQVKLDGSEVRRLAHHRSRPFDTYVYQPKVSVSNDATRLVFGSNWGLPDAAYTNYADDYIMQLDNVAPPTDDFSVSALPASQTIVQGGGTSFASKVNPQNNFSGVVTFTVTGLPSDATATFTPPSVAVSGSSESSTLTINTASGVATGTFSLTITGVNGSLARTASVTLVINAAPDFTLAASPASQTIVRGGATAYTATVAGLNDFSGVVSFRVTGLPPGAAATFTFPSVTGSGSSTLDIITTGDVLSGTYPLLITGTSGNLAHTASVTLTITMPNFLLTANPLGQTIRAGNSASYTITVTPQDGFAADVSLSVSGLPSGLSAVFNPPSISGGAGSSTMTIGSPSSARGRIILTITGTGGGLSRTTTVILRIRHGTS